MRRFITSITVGVLLASTLFPLVPVGVSAPLHVHANVAAAQVVNTPPEQSRSNAGGAGLEVCSWRNLNFQACLWQPLASAVGWLLIGLGGSALRLAGLVFDSLIEAVIISYANTLDRLNIMEAITTGWTVIRDFSNILIIGLFVFLAISIILGLKEFGNKRLIANVLIVAVLMNFSLLFTKVIIDGSNFVSYQIYRQMAGQNSSADFDISQAFLSPMGIAGVWDTYPLLRNTAAAAGGGQVLAFGIIGGILLFLVALVLFYGSFLIAARAVLFIFLMLTAPLAFITYLHPSLARGEYGWEAWWKALVNNAAFGPLLMILLAVSLIVIVRAGEAKKATFGEILGNPTQLTLDMTTTILVYIIGIGLLFVSMKLAGAFAGTISGFRLGAAIPALAFGAGARVAAFAGRNTFGKAGSLTSRALQTQAQKAPDNSWRQFLYTKGAQGAKAVAKTDFNIARTPGLGSGIAGAAGVKVDTLAGKKVGGFEGAAKARAKKAAEEADFLHVDKDKRAKIEKEVVETKIQESPDLKDRHAALEEAHTGSKQVLEEAQKSEVVATENAARAIRAAQAQLERAKASRDENAIEDATKNEGIVRAQHENELKKQAQRIAQAKKDVARASEAISNLKDGVRNAAIETGELKEFAREGDLAAGLAHHRLTNLIARKAGINDVDNDYIAQLARKAVKEHHESKNAKKVADYLKEKTGGHDDHGGAGAGHGAPPKPQAPKPASGQPGAPDGHDNHGGGHQ